MGKVIARLSEHPELSCISEEMNQLAEHAKERQEFLEKQSNRLKEEIMKKRDDLWERTKKYLAKNKILSLKEQKDAPGLTFDDEAGCVRLLDKPRHPLEMLQALMEQK